MFRLRLLVPAATVCVTALHAQSPATRLPVPGAPTGVAAFVGVHVVPMDTERVLTNHTVLVQHAGSPLSARE